MLTLIAVTRSEEGVNGDGGLWFASGNVRFAGGGWSCNGGSAGP
jgi:hypothetical protein